MIVTGRHPAVRGNGRVCSACCKKEEDEGRPVRSCPPPASVTAIGEAHAARPPPSARACPCLPSLLRSPGCCTDRYSGLRLVASAQNAFRCWCDTTSNLPHRLVLILNRLLWQPSASTETLPQSPSEVVLALREHFISSATSDVDPFAVLRSSSAASAALHPDGVWHGSNQGAARHLPASRLTRRPNPQACPLRGRHSCSLGTRCCPASMPPSSSSSRATAACASSRCTGSRPTAGSCTSPRRGSRGTLPLWARSCRSCATTSSRTADTSSSAWRGRASRSHSYSLPVCLSFTHPPTDLSMSPPTYPYIHAPFLASI